MLIQPTLDALNRLKLNGMALALSEQMTRPAAQQFAFEERIALLLEREVIHRENSRMGRLWKPCQPKERGAVIEDIDYRGRAGLDRAQLASLASCEWICQSQNLLIHGACGAGKPYLACVLAHQACRARLSAWYARAPRFFEELSLCHADGAFRKRLAAIAKINLVIIDDFAISPIGPREHNYLLEFRDDRLIHCSHKIHLHGKESMRERASKKAGKGQGDGEVTAPSTRPRRCFCPPCGRSDSPTASR